MEYMAKKLAKNNVDVSSVEKHFNTKFSCLQCCGTALLVIIYLSSNNFHKLKITL